MRPAARPATWAAPPRAVRRVVAAVAIAVAAAACGADFEDPAIVLDLRMLGARAEPPEVLLPPDAEPEDVDVPDIDICALVADPGASRRLAWEMVACAPTSSGRCDRAGAPFVPVGSGVVDDPDEAEVPVPPCGTLRPSPALADILRQSIDEDPLQGFSSVAVQVEIFVKPEGAADADGIYGVKRALFAPQLPPDRAANRNPSVDGVRIARAGDAEPAEDVALARCTAADAAPIALVPGEEIALFPVEPDGVRERYVLPTLDGGSRSFTENLTYSWFATAGSFSAATTGGPTDAFGNAPRLDTRFTAPDVDAPADVALWLVVRDERGGAAWYEMCARVEP
ncbi:MAG: hypothetical protein D6689_07910 [Deltaproteobacteria bacterium]|nr:MAG: hypothetical protein D6689_07910 [Deltaproteobacteria bacterium]